MKIDTYEQLKNRLEILVSELLILNDAELLLFNNNSCKTFIIHTKHLKMGDCITSHSQ